MSKPSPRDENLTLTNAEMCLRAIRRMIITGVLLPGQKVHQADLAVELQVSRIPLREALSTLAAEGILTHRRNSGYEVARFSSSDLEELYLMRRLLETELLKTAKLGSEQADKLQHINGELQLVDPAEDPRAHEQLNYEFHFALFETSQLRLVLEEVKRLWYRSSFYRALYVYEIDTPELVLTEHKAIIEAVREENMAELISISDQHRQGTEVLTFQKLGRPRLG